MLDLADDFEMVAAGSDCNVSFFDPA